MSVLILYTVTSPIKSKYSDSFFIDVIEIFSIASFMVLNFCLNVICASISSPVVSSTNLIVASFSNLSSFVIIRFSIPFFYIIKYLS
jgi:hypothetical protein